MTWIKTTVGSNQHWQSLPVAPIRQVLPQQYIALDVAPESAGIISGTGSVALGAPALAATGAVDTSGLTTVARFTGVANQWLDIRGPGATAPGNLGISADPFTFVALVSTDAIVNTFQGIFQNGDGAGGNTDGGAAGTGFQVGLDAGPSNFGTVDGGLFALIGTGNTANGGEPVFTTDTWYLVAVVVRSDTAQSLYLYNFTTSAWQHQHTTASAATTAPKNNTANIGNYRRTTGADAYSEWWNGDMAWMGLWPSDKSNSGSNTPADIQAFIDDGPWSQIDDATFFIAFDNEDLLDEAGAASTSGRYVVLNSTAITFPELADVPNPRPAGGGAITGTGAVTIGAPSLAASGAKTHTATAALSVAAPSLAASGAQTITGTGSVSIGAPSSAGSGLKTHTGTGTLAIAASSLAATGAETYSGTATVLVGAPLISGSGTSAGAALTGTAAITIGGPSLAGNGAWGDVISGGATLAINTPSLAANGLLVPQAITGTGAITIGAPVLQGTDFSSEPGTVHAGVELAGHVNGGALLVGHANAGALLVGDVNGGELLLGDVNGGELLVGTMRGGVTQ